MKKYAKNSNYNTKIILTFMLKNVNNENNGNNNYDNVYILLKIAIKRSYVKNYICAVNDVVLQQTITM